LITTLSPVIRRPLAVLPALCAPILILGLAVAPPSAMRAVAEDKCVGIGIVHSDPTPFAPGKYWGERAEHEANAQMCATQITVDSGPASQAR
jgi:hypothetical protein